MDYQATGMVAVQLHVGTDEALGFLRAHAWAHGRPLDAVSTDIATRRLSFDGNQPPSSERRDPGGPG